MSTSDSSPGARRPGDPFELWRQIYETNERAWNAVLERTVSNPQFAESSGKILETFLGAQKTVRDNMRQYLEQINLPTREDIGRLGELIVSLEEKVDQLDDRLARMEDSLAARAQSSVPPPPPAPPAAPPATSTTLIDPSGASLTTTPAAPPAPPTPPAKPDKPTPGSRGAHPSPSRGLAG